MNQKVKFDAKIVEGKLELTQTAVKTLDIKEAMKEQMQVSAHALQAEKAVENMKKQIEDKVWEKQLADAEENANNLHNLTKDLEKALEPRIQELKTIFKTEIKLKKAETGYDRSKGDQKIVMQNRIIGAIATEHDVDMGHPMIRELKNEFDNI